MTNEQRKAIRQCELYVQAKATIQLVDEIDGKLAFKSCDTSAIDTVLSLIKENQKEIEGLKNINRNQSKDIKKAVDYTFELNKELDKKDKQIDLMAELVYKRFKAELLLEYGFENEEQLKQYFADLVEKE